MRLLFEMQGCEIVAGAFKTMIDIHKGEWEEKISATIHTTLNHGTPEWTMSVGKTTNVIDIGKTAELKKKMGLSDSNLTAHDLIEFSTRLFIETYIGDFWENREGRGARAGLPEGHAWISFDFDVPPETEDKLKFLDNDTELTKLLHGVC